MQGPVEFAAYFDVAQGRTPIFFTHSFASQVLVSTRAINQLEIARIYDALFLFCYKMLNYTKKNQRSASEIFSLLSGDATVEIVE